MSLKFTVLGGSSIELDEEKGSAHLLSLAAFAGTTSKSGLRLIRELEDIGAVVSASSDREKITIQVTVVSSMVELAFERMAETLLSPPRNKHVLLEYVPTAQISYNSAHTNPKIHLAELLHEAAFSEESPMGSSYYNQNIELLNPERVLQFRNNNFIANNIVISSTGVDHNILKELTQKYLSKLPANPNNKISGNSPYVGGYVKVRGDYDGRTYLALAFPVSETGNNVKPYNVLKTMLCSKLCKKSVCEKHGQTTSFFVPYAKCILLLIKYNNYYII